MTTAHFSTGGVPRQADPTPPDRTLLDRADWDKGGGLLPAIVQDARTAQVLMLAYMNRAALERTFDSGWVTFYSRSRPGLWTKGETSGHRLALCDAALDCDRDTFLIQAVPQGPVCHTGTRTCWNREAPAGVGFIAELARIIATRAAALENPANQAPAKPADAAPPASYTARLLLSGLPRIAQKVGEEGVETALAAVTASDSELTGEAADLIYHLLVLLQARGITLDAVTQCLIQRHRPG